MDLDKQIKLSHLLLTDRKCRTCGEIKNLIDSFYRTHKERGPVASSFSYECKECAIKRVTKLKKRPKLVSLWEYPDC
jgi:hypothetical protein